MLLPPSRCSITSMVESKPLTSWNAARVIPSITTWKLKLPYGSLRSPVAMVVSSPESGFGDVGAARPDADADDDEFRGEGGIDSDLEGQSAELSLGERIEVFVDADVEG